MYGHMSTKQTVKLNAADLVHYDPPANAFFVFLHDRLNNADVMLSF